MKEKIRCSWCTKDSLYIEYHDNEWGIPIFDDTKLFEFLILEIFQACGNMIKTFFFKIIIPIISCCY